MKKVALLTLGIVLISVCAHAHSFWINAFESQAHNSHHAMVSLGWGHALPMDDILNSTNGRIEIDRFEILDPALKKTDLLKPKFKLSEPELSTNNFDLFAADIGVQKIAFKKEISPGVYQVAASSKPTFYTQYIDKQEKTRLKLKPKDAVKDIKKVLMSVKYQAFAKSYLTVGSWTMPKSLGHGLEIIPITDLSNLHTGDLIKVNVLFYGKPLTTTAKSMEFITARSSSFGQTDGFELFSHLKGGKAQFRVQSAGQWIINVSHKDDVTKDGPLKDLFGKADIVYHSASLTFNVK